MGILMQKEVKQRAGPKDVRDNEAKESGQWMHGMEGIMEEEVQEGTCLLANARQSRLQILEKDRDKGTQISHPQKHLREPAKALVCTTRNWRSRKIWRKLKEKPWPPLIALLTQPLVIFISLNQAYIFILYFKLKRFHRSERYKEFGITYLRNWLFPLLMNAAMF